MYICGITSISVWKPHLYTILPKINMLFNVLYEIIT